MSEALLQPDVLPPDRRHQVAEPLRETHTGSGDASAKGTEMAFTHNTSGTLWRQKTFSPFTTSGNNVACRQATTI